MMRPYGLEYTLIVGPDVADVQVQGRKSSIGHFATKSGEFRSYTRNPKSRAATRRTIKRRARAAGNAQIARELRDAA